MHFTAFALWVRRVADCEEKKRRSRQWVYVLSVQYIREEGSSRSEEMDRDGERRRRALTILFFGRSVSQCG